MEAAVPSRDISLIRHRHRRQLTTVFLEGNPAVPSVAHLARIAVTIPLNLGQNAGRRVGRDFGKGF